MSRSEPVEKPLIFAGGSTWDRLRLSRGGSSEGSIVKFPAKSGGWAMSAEPKNRKKWLHRAALLGGDPAKQGGEGRTFHLSSGFWLFVWTAFGSGMGVALRLRVLCEPGIAFAPGPAQLDRRLSEGRDDARGGPCRGSNQQKVVTWAAHLETEPAKQGGEVRTSHFSSGFWLFVLADSVVAWRLRYVCSVPGP